MSTAVNCRLFLTAMVRPLSHTAFMCFLRHLYRALAQTVEASTIALFGAIFLFIIVIHTFLYRLSLLWLSDVCA